MISLDVQWRLQNIMPGLRAGLEDVVASELSAPEVGAYDVRAGKAGVHFRRAITFCRSHASNAVHFCQSDGF